MFNTNMTKLEYVIELSVMPIGFMKMWETSLKHLLSELLFCPLVLSSPHELYLPFPKEKQNKTCLYWVL